LPLEIDTITNSAILKTYKNLKAEQHFLGIECCLYWGKCFGKSWGRYIFFRENTWFFYQKSNVSSKVL